MIPVPQLAKVKITGDTLTKGIFRDSPEKATKIAEELTNGASQKEHACLIGLVASIMLASYDAEELAWIAVLAGAACEVF